MPFIAKWPGKIKANTKSNAVINGTDLFATLAELLEIDMKEKYPELAPDSFSFYNCLINQSQEHQRPPMVVRDSIRIGDWKLISSRGKKEFNLLTSSDFELYNLKNDIGEKNNIALSNPERVDEIYKEFKKYMNERKLKENK